MTEKAIRRSNVGEEQAIESHHLSRSEKEKARLLDLQKKLRLHSLDVAEHREYVGLVQKYGA